MENFFSDESVDSPCFSSNTSNETPQITDLTNIESQQISRSAVWLNFKKIDKTLAQCNVCKKLIKTCGSTTTLSRHARTHTKTTGTIDETAGVVVPLASDSPRARELTEAIAKLLIISDLEPYCIVERRGFRRFMSVVDPRYVIPHRTTFSREIIPNLYETEKSRIKKLIHKDIEEGVTTLAFTTDGWTSRSIESFISLTVHYVTKDFQPRKFTLAMSHMPEAHTGRNLHDFLQATIDEWGLENGKIESTLFTVDNAANIVAAIRMGRQWIRIPCFAHTLQLAVKDAIKNTAVFTKICRKAQTIVSFFARSSTGCSKLKEAQLNLRPGKKPLKLVQNVDTRWNSQYDMMARLIELKKPLSVVLCERGMSSNFTESEWTALEQYVEVLGPVKEATVLMSSETYPTLSQYMPVIEILKKASDDHIEAMEVDDSVNSIEEHLEERVSSIDEAEDRDTDDLGLSLSVALRTRFKFIDTQNDLLVFAMVLDPRFKDRFLANGEEKQDVWRRLKIRARSCGIENANQLADAVSTRRRDLEGEPKSKLLRLFEEHLETESDNREDGIDQELTMYLQEKVAPRNASVFSWWSINRHRFPKLAELSRQFLNVPASQTTSERLFSTAGNIVTPKRAQLLSEHVEQLAFLHENFE